MSACAFVSFVSSGSAAAWLVCGGCLWVVCVVLCVAAASYCTVALNQVDPWCVDGSA